MPTYLNSFYKTLLFLLFLASSCMGEANPCLEKAVCFKERGQGAPPLQEAFVSVYFNGIYRQEILGLMTPDGFLVKVKFREICCLLEDAVPCSYLETLGDCQDFRGWILVDDLSDLHPAFDEETLTLSLCLAADQRSRDCLDYADCPCLDLSDAVDPACTSAYANIRHNLTYGDGDASYLLNLETYIRHQGWVLEAHMDVQPERRRIFSYEDLRLIRDFPCSLTRLSIGEDQSFRARMLSSDRIQGIKYSTEFALQPQLITEPISEFSFFLERDSQVEIWVNGEEQDLVRLNAGPYDIRNLPLTTGFNEVLLKITDDLGHQEVLSFNAVRGPNLLSPGRCEFAYSLGVRGSGNDYGGDPILSASFRRGWTSHVTLCSEFRMDPHHLGVSGGLQFASPWCFGTLDIAGSKFDELQGAAVRAVIGKKWGCLTLSSRTDFRTRKYLTQRQTLNSQREHWAQRMMASMKLGKQGGTLSLRYNYIDAWEGNDVRRVEGSWQKSFWGNWRVQLTGSHTMNAQPESELRVIVGYQVIGDCWDRLHSARIGRSRKFLRTTISGSHRHDHPVDWTLNHYRDQVRGRSAVDTLQASVRKYGRYGSVYYSGWVDEIGRNPVYRHNANAECSIAYADGYFAMGPLIYDAFAMVRVPSELDDADFLVYSDRGEEVLARARRTSLLTQLQAYHPTELYFESIDPGLDIESRSILLVPPYRGGVLLVPDEEDEFLGVVVVNGILVDQKGVPVSLQAVEIRDVNFPEADPFLTFTNREGEFRATGLRLSGKYELSIFSMPELKYEVPVPGDWDPMLGIDMGILNPLPLWRKKE